MAPVSFPGCRLTQVLTGKGSKVMLEISQAFDANYYSTMNPDLAAAGLVGPEALFNHFITFGIDEGRSFSPYVEIDYYAAINPDLQAAGLTSNRQFLDHLIAYGVNERRLFSPNVDLNFYAAANQDLGAAGLTTGEQLFDHLINYGAREGRQLVGDPTSNLGLKPTPPPPPPPPPLPPPGLPTLPNSQTQTFAGGMLLGGSSSIAAALPNVNELLTQGLAVATEQLNDFLAAPDLATKIATAFGQEVDLAAVNNLIAQLANAQDLPKIEILSGEDIGGVSGAFDSLTNTVYVSQPFLLQNANNSDAIAGVLLEEIGHSIDARVNPVDAPGDEGQIFAAFVQGKNLSQADVLAWQSENDQTTISPYGQPILVETSDTAWTTYVWDWNWNYLGDTTLSKRDDGLNGINLDLGSTVSNGISSTFSIGGYSDYFIMGMWHDSYFDANTSYRFRVSGDDGFYLLISQDGENWQSLTNDWNYAYQGFNEYIFQPSSSGYHYVFAYLFEREGNAYLDLSWQPDNGSDYYPELASLSEDEWDRQSGDNNQFEQYSSDGDQRWKTDDRIEQIYTDLSTAIFGYRVPMGAGYAYDESYHNSEAIINGTTGWWHSAFDMGADYGTPIKAAVGGTVQWFGGEGDGYVGVGIKSDDGRQWIYHHLQSSSGLWEGKRINAGEDVGLVGWFNGAPHLHLAVGNDPESIVSEMQDQDKLLSVTVSPLMAYWQWRNQ
ncbi:M23 family metallopeptidase [[Phormidium] sp. ETS-05]|uniref:M23 family metallopeptidase n=1 Tax=[Phormidium] sp. ETS-05 TaxID=222819 RepID=UPI0018EF01A4|nr:M23 family metallopeptidase [[Phormidium] sp. ETS-05]